MKKLNAEPDVALHTGLSRDLKIENSFMFLFVACLGFVFYYLAMDDQFSVPRYGVIEHPERYAQKKWMANKTEFREWLSVEQPCFYINGRACRFSNILLLKDSINRYALLLKYDKVIFAITPANTRAKISTYKNGDPFTDSEIGTLRGYLSALTKGLSPNAVYSVASELFHVQKLTPLYSYIRFEAVQKPKKKKPESAKPKPSKPQRPVVLIKKSRSV